MGKNYDIVALGELLIDFTERKENEGSVRVFEQNPGGAPANMLTSACHLGSRVAFIGKVGADMHGSFLIDTLKREKIDTRGVITDQKYFTTMAFVEVGAGGERSFSFARKPGADVMLRKEELDRELLSECRVFHFGSLSLTAEPARSATIEAIRIAKQSGAVVSYDPNYREALWENREIAVEQIKSVINLVDIMKVSDEESVLLTGKEAVEDAADELLGYGVKLVAVTLGDEGVLIARKGKKERVKAFKVETVDTTGAGDSFWGGFVSTLLEHDEAIELLDWEDIKKCALIGNAVAGLCVQGRGGIPSIPEKEQVYSYIS